MMFNFFKKKHKNEQKTVNVSKKQTRPFRVEEHKANLQLLYDCSVQRTAQNFKVENSQYAMDGLYGCCDTKGMQQLYQPNFVGEEIIFTHFAANGFIGFNNCAILAQDWLINKALAMPCEDAIAVNYDITLQGDETSSEDKDIIAEIKDVSEQKDRFNIKSICQEFAENKRKYGQALCIPLIEGVDYSMPFNIDAVKPKSYKGMVNIEPIWTTPVLDVESTTNPLSERFYKPTWFRMPDGTNVHYTWFLFNTYGDVPDILKPTYYFGGYPLPQQLYQQVYAAHKTAKEAPMLAQSKRLNYVEGNLNAYLADEDKLTREVKAMSWLRNNWGWLLIKKDQRIGQLDTSLTDFDAVTMLGYQIVAAISCVPSARLLETSPKGWQSNGSYEDNNYKKLLQSIQRLDYCPILDLHYRLFVKSEYGLDKYYNCVFDEIDTPTEKERAEIRELNSRTDMNYVQAGVISSEEVRSVLRADIKSGYNSLSEEMEGGEEEDPFTDIDEDNGDNPPPFSMDEWEESKHPRKNNGQFGKGGGSGKVEKSSNRDKIKNRERKAVQLPKEEYAQVMHELNTNLSKEQRKSKQIIKAIGNSLYTVVNNGFNDYKIIKKEQLDDIN